MRSNHFSPHPAGRQIPTAYEGSSNGFPPASSSRQPSGSGSYYYSSRPANSAAPSPAHSYRTNHSANNHHSTSTMAGRRGGEVEYPSYQVEHLATFAVGRQFGLQYPTDGVRKLKQMEKNSAIWAQPMILKLKGDKISVEDENGEIVEQFPMELVVEPTAHQSTDPQDMYNNILLFIVKEDTRNGRRPVNPTEMHIFQCVKVSAQDVAADIQAFSKGQYNKVRGGRRDTGYNATPNDPYGPWSGSAGGPFASKDSGARFISGEDASPSSNGSDTIDMNVNTLNRCFDDIERFVARIQSVAIAQRELEMQNARYRTKQRSKGRVPEFSQQGILQLRAQMPSYNEFYEIFQKFKLSFNILTMVKNYIHEPNAPELLHFLFTPLTVILDACHWGLGKNVAEQVASPLISFDACELLRNCLTSKEYDVWMSLGKYWRTPPEDWQGPLPPPYRPVFNDGYAPYGYPQQPFDSFIGNGSHGAPTPIHRGVSAPPTQHAYPPRPVPHRERSVDNINVERMNLEKERMEMERMRMLERERRLDEEERRLRAEEARLEAERKLLQVEAERRSITGVSDKQQFYSSSQASPLITERRSGSVQMLSNGHVGTFPSPTGEISPRQKAFLDDLAQRRSKIVQVTYDRVAQNAKELTVARGEYLEVLNDAKNWWECRNVNNRVGYVPHTILSVVSLDSLQSNLEHRVQQLPQHNPPSLQSGPSLSPRPASIYTVSDAQVQTNIHRVEKEVPIQPSYPVRSSPPPAPVNHAPKAPPVPDLGSVQLRPARLRPEIQNEDNKPKLIIKRNDHIRYVPEMIDTIKSKQLVIGTRRIPSNKGLMISENSTPKQVQNWMIDKGFSEYVINLFSEHDGNDLFSLSKPKLMQYCGEEGSRLYSLLLVQKRRSNYDSMAKSELKALLNLRKQHVDSTNEAAEEPEDTPAPPSSEFANSPPMQNNISGSSQMGGVNQVRSYH